MAEVDIGTASEVTVEGDGTPSSSLEVSRTTRGHTYSLKIYQGEEDTIEDLKAQALDVDRWFDDNFNDEEEENGG